LRPCSLFSTILHFFTTKVCIGAMDCREAEAAAAAAGARPVFLSCPLTQREAGFVWREGWELRGGTQSAGMSGLKERKKENRQPTRGMGGGQGPHLREQDLVRTIRDTGERERGAHRDTEGGWAGFTHTTGSQGFLSRIGQSRCTRGGTGAGARASYWFCALLVLLLLTRDSAPPCLFYPLSRRSPPCLVLRRRRRPPIPLLSRLLPPLGATPPSWRRILAPRVYRAILAQTSTLLTPTPIICRQAICRCSAPLSFRALVPPRLVLALGLPSIS